MSMQPYQRPDRISLWKKSTAEKRADETILAAQIAGIVQAIRISNAYKLRRAELDMSIALADEIMENLAETDNPLKQQALLHSFKAWQTQVDLILNQYHS